jgi:microsomal dipeptidase-like Zn-dependent dipeptidase
MNARVLLPCLLALACLGLLPAAAGAAETRYSLANGCFTATDASGKPVAEKVRMKPTALGRYLLFRTDQTYVTAQDGALGSAPQASAAADFEVKEAAGGAFTLTPFSSEQPVATVTFVPAEGCAVFPEADLNSTGVPGKGDLSYGRVSGIVEGHMHWMAFQNFGGSFNCGAPWHPYGITEALPDCSEIEGPQGLGAPIQNTFTYSNPAQAHDTRGYPYLTSWSKDQLTYTGTYYRWVERVWQSGLRLMVMGVNENRVLCELTTQKKYDCNEMNSMRRGFKAIKELEDYVDAQAGGPGKGFFEIVTDPFQARRVINQGRMAVVLEIETSEPFDCIGWQTVTCDKAQIDRQLDEMYKLGVRSSLLLNKYDNPLTGVRFDSGVAGYLINAGNKRSAGTFFSARTCKGELHDNTIESGDNPASSAADQILTTIGLGEGTTPVYPPPPHCNTRGLTELGRHTVRRMMDLGMIVNPDHMSQAAVDDTLTLLESRDYSGVISPHGWVDPGNWPRLWKLGGMAFPGHSGADNYIKEWQDFRPRETPFEFGWGYGADLGGISHQPDSSKKGSISYPFKSYDGKVTFDRQKTGERTFDYAKEGVAHYGLYADWFQDLYRLGGKQMADDMNHGAEAYLQMWERAVGVENKRCFFQEGGLTRSGRGPIRLGDDWQTVLERAGQPQQRDRTWSWCVKGPGNTKAADVAVMDTAGKVILVGTTARSRQAQEVRIGARGKQVIPGRSIGGGLKLKRSGNRTFVFAVKGGKLRALAITSAKLAGNRKALRSAMRRVLTAKASAAPRKFVPAKAQAKGAMLGRSLAGSADREVNKQLALLCGLNL